MRRFRFYVAASWRPGLLWMLATVLVAALFFWQLETMTPSYAAAEQDTVGHLFNRDLGVRDIFENPVFLPYQLGIYLLEKIHMSGVYAARALSALLGVLAVGCFYYIISRWHTRRVALLGTLLFATSSWLLHTARLATPEASFLMLLPLVACGTWLNETTRRGLKPLAIGLGVSGLLVYIPGLFWFVLAGIVWQRKKVSTELRKLRAWEIAIVGLLGLLTVTPLIIGAAKDTSLLLTIIGLPGSVPELKEIGMNAANVAKHLFVRGPSDPTRWVGSMPLLDTFATVTFVVGIYSYSGRLRLDRTKLLLLGLLVGALLVSLDSTSMAILLPFVYLISAAGVTYLLQEWLGVFPRNPLARGVGSTLMTAAVLLAAFYNLNHYFVAWANAPETRETFSRQL